MNISEMNRLMVVGIIVVFASTGNACSATTRLSRYVPSVSLYWWRSNVTSINQTTPVNPKPTETDKFASVEISESDMKAELKISTTTPLPLLPIRTEQESHRPKYYRVSEMLITD